MTPEQIDAVLATPYPIPPKTHTVADVLTTIFDENWDMRRKTMTAVGGEVIHMDLTLHFTVPMEVAKVHLKRLMKLEQSQI